MSKKLIFLTSFVLVLGVPAAAVGRTIYVDDDAVGANDGSSWADAYWCLQDALDAAQYGDGIRVAQGTYKPDQRVMITREDSEVRSSGDRTETFQLKNGVIIKGGYAGFDEPDPDARDIKLYETILSGDLNDDDGPNFAKNDENSYHVVSVIDDIADKFLDGFLITGGNANSSDDDSRGGGMFNSFAGIIVTNCTFMQNSANEYGGAVCNEGCFVVAFNNCLFVNNFAGLDGGAVGNMDNLVIMFQNSVFTGNSANEQAGAIDNWFSMVAVLNCTFSNNSAGVDAGGMNSWFGALGLKNCILWKNRDNNGLNRDESAQIYSIIDEPLVNYCCIEGLTGRLRGEGNIRANPDFVDPDGPDRVAGTKDDNLRLSADSPCIDAGDNSAVPVDFADFDGDGDFEELYPYDFDGLPRCIDDPDTVDTGIGIAPIVDMGAYEFGRATPPSPTPTPSPSQPDPLSEALDTDLRFTTGGSADWFSQTTTTRYDGDAAQSGDISRNQDSWMQTTVSGAGTVKFYWKVSSEEDYDFLEFYIDGSLQEKISGLEDEWERQTYTISTSGSHTLEWRYMKDPSGDSGSDCGWVDKVEW